MWEYVGMGIISQYQVKLHPKIEMLHPLAYFSMGRED